MSSSVSVAEPSAVVRLAQEDQKSAQTRQSFVLFSTLWGVYTLSHQLLTYWDWFQFSDPVHLGLGGLSLVAACILLLRPGSVARLAFVAAAGVAYKMYLIPEVANHIFLTLLINVTLLLSIGYWRLRGGGDVQRPVGSLYRQFAPLLRIELLALYFFAVLHKLNWDFFNPQVSCGWILYVQTMEALGLSFTPDWMRWPAILGALSLELVIPILLVIPRTRLAGIVLGLAFHLVLAMHPNIFIASFTSMLFALYALFLPEPIAAGLVERGRKCLESAGRTGLLVVVGVAVAMAGAAAVFVVMTGRLSRDGLIEALHLLAPSVLRGGWLIMVLVLYGVLLHELSGRAGAVRPTVAALLTPRWTPALLIPILVILNGFMPYVGLKTQSAFSMFSNLRTEAGSTNHLFMPVDFRLADYQQDMVRIVDSTDGYLSRTAQKGQWLPVVELRRRSGRIGDPDFTVTYIRDGREITVSRRERPDHALFVPLSLAESKLLLFRPTVAPGEPCDCVH